MCVCARVCLATAPGLANSPGVIGQVGNDILQDLLQILIYLKCIRTDQHPTVTPTSLFYIHLMYACCTRLRSYRGLISDQGVPDAGHSLANAQVGVKLVAVQSGHNLGQERGQLLPGLGRDHVETKRCPLKGREVRWWEWWGGGVHVQWMWKPNEGMRTRYLAGVPHGMMIGQVHELVDQIRLVQVAGQRAELLVRSQAVTVGWRGGTSKERGRQRSICETQKHFHYIRQSQKCPTVATSDLPIRSFPQPFSLEHLSVF